MSIFSQRIQRNLAAQRTGRNQRQFTIEVNGTLDHQGRQRVHLISKGIQRCGVAQQPLVLAVVAQLTGFDEGRVAHRLHRGNQ